MNKLKVTSLAALTTLMVLSGCSKKQQIIFWTGFGGDVNAVLEPLLARYEKETGVSIKYETKGGYPALNQAISLSVSNEAYPHIANGYPDHFAGYLASNILLSLDGFINSTEEGIGVDIDDFNPFYLKENQEMAFQRDENGNYDKTKPLTIGLPFNKSTEILVANEDFFRVMQIYDPTIKIPETWDELATIGPKLVSIPKDNNFFGNVVMDDGSVVLAPDVPRADGDKTVHDEFAKNVAFDFRNVKEEKFRPINWDSKSNFFITAIRQWGGVYTEMGRDINEGFIRFDSQETRDALTFFQDMYRQKVFATPTSFGSDLYGSNAFKRGECVLTISSSAGAAQNVPVDNEFPFEVSSNPIPYKDPTRKYVISQGTNLALFDRGDAAIKREAWKLLRYLTTEVNDIFGKGTSYFPVTKTMQNSPIYSEFLNADPVESNFSPREVAIQKTAIMNHDVYEDPANEWLRFTDPAFVGSAFIRQEIEVVMDEIFSGGKTPDQVINEMYKKLSKYVEK